MMKAEYRKDCLQRDSVEREGYAGVPSVGARDNRERDNANQALWYLNRRVPNGTHGGVRGRGLITPSYSIIFLKNAKITAQLLH